MDGDGEIEMGEFIGSVGTAGVTKHNPRHGKKSYIESV